MLAEMIQIQRPKTETAGAIQREIRDDGICVVTFDRSGSSGNVFDSATLAELDSHIDAIRADRAIKGVVFISAKPSIFIAGADLREIAGSTDEQKVVKMIELGQTVFNRIAALPIPTVAAIHGAAVGGGYELCLACDYRIASPDRVTKIGLPETQLGLIPAWGGSTRLPRLIGLPAALDIILAGKTVAAKQALKRGMIDDIAPKENLLALALKKIRQGKSSRPAKFAVNNRLVARAICARVRPKVMAKTRGNYPAVTAALELVTRGISEKIERSFEMERETVLALSRTPECRNLVRVFFLQERSRRLKPHGAPIDRMVARTAVIGSGIMGAGIAQWLSARELPVILRDIDAAQIAKGMASIAKLYEQGVKRRVLTRLEAKRGMDLVHPAATEVPMRNVDLIIEAALEKLDVKQKIFRRLEELTEPDAILATNTSALSVSEIASDLAHPERVVGIHFFNPVHRMQLVEVNVGKRTSAETVQRAVRFVQRIGKLPVVVRDSPGFLVNRILMPYLIEAALLFEAGAAVEDIDKSMLDFGMPMGPLRLLDEVGIDIATDVAATVASHFSERMPMPAVLLKLKKLGLLGRKSGRGFYLHQKGVERVNSQADKFRENDSARRFPREALQRRMVLLMINEAARCLEEKVIDEPEDVDFAMIMGTGFAPFRGGPLRYADDEGIDRLVDEMKRLSDAGEPRFQPCDLLAEMAAKSTRFYPSEPGGSMPNGATRARKSGGNIRSLNDHSGTTFSKQKTSQSAPGSSVRRQSTANGIEEAPATIDTSKMSAGQRAALELTEAAREAMHGKPGFAAGVFMGRFDLALLHPFPEQSLEDRDQGDAFLKRLEVTLREHADPDQIDIDGEIPQAVVDRLAELGAFGIKISPEFGGLGLSQTNYERAAMLLGSYCGNLTALVSAHQSIGVPQPLILFGTEEQKHKFLPRVAKGEISAFALTETGAGSDPATMELRADPSADGSHFILNGQKLWCTNGTKAGVIVVMARTPPKIVDGRERKQITAFIVEMDTPGVEVVHRCRFMGLKSLYNAVVRFTDARIPRENIILAEGKGLRVALTTLNTGRLTLPAACVGLSKRCLQICRKWANERVQWGAPIGKHAAIADKIARMAANIFAMESMVLYASSLVDRDRQADVRLEAAMCKLWGTEIAWETVNDTMQIRGGRGYETAASLKGRGEEPVAVERMFRDSRINMIFEGSSEIMRLFIAREALDAHLKIGAAVVNSQLPFNERARAAVRAAGFYARWYPRQWAPKAIADGFHPVIVRHLRFASRATRKLARAMFHAMARYGPKLERMQLLLGRFDDIGTELFAIAATCSRAQRLLERSATGEEKKNLLSLVDYFCRSSKLRIERHFTSIRHNADGPGYRFAQQTLAGDFEWLEEGIVGHL